MHDFRRHVLDYYNRAAGHYDLSEFIRRGTRQKVVKMSDWQPGERVLDVCTGTGELALAFSRRGAAVVGVDIARGMLERAAAKPANPKPMWLEMDAANLHFEDHAFDISTISLALHHMPEGVQRDVLAEMARVTRRRIMIVEPHTPTHRRLWPLWALVASRIDESEHLANWVRQDFAATCQAASLKVERAQVTTSRIHRITLCAPNGMVSQPG